jgi:amidophosphoribosyltransferase
MAKLEDFIAFRAALALHKEAGNKAFIEEIYNRCKASMELANEQIVNHVQEFYAPLATADLSKKISELLCPPHVKAEVRIIYQTIENLHKACPHNLGDWYFTGNYPTPGGRRVVNRAFINFFEGKNQRAY